MRTILIVFCVVLAACGGMLFASAPWALEYFNSISLVQGIVGFASNKGLPVPVTGLLLVLAAAGVLVLIVLELKDTVSTLLLVLKREEERGTKFQNENIELGGKLEEIEAANTTRPMPDTADVEERLDYLREEIAKVQGIVESFEDTDEYKKRWPTMIGELSMHINMLSLQATILVDNVETNKRLKDLIARVTSVQELVTPAKPAPVHEAPAAEIQQAHEPAADEAAHHTPELKVVS